MLSGWLTAVLRKHALVVCRNPLLLLTLPALLTLALGTGFFWLPDNRRIDAEYLYTPTDARYILPAARFSSSRD